MIIKFDEEEFNFNPYLFKKEEELNFKNIYEKFPNIFINIEQKFKRNGRKYICTTFRVRDILNNSFKKAIIRKYYYDNI